MNIHEGEQWVCAVDVQTYILSTENGGEMSAVAFVFQNGRWVTGD